MGWSPFRKKGVTYKDSRTYGGYTLIAPIGGDAVYLLDIDGLVVHQWKVPSFEPGYGFLLPGGNLLVRGQHVVDEVVRPGEPASSTDILIELDWDSNEVWRWEHETFHHDMARLPNGNTIVIVWEVLPEERLEGMLSDAIWEINPAGEPVHIWHSWEHFDTETDKLCPVDFPFEWTHLNAVELTPEGDILTSSQKLDKVMKISWPEGKVLWKWGGLGKLSHQHDPTITPDGTCLVFDNGAKHPPISRSRVVEVDMETDEIYCRSGAVG